MIFWSRNGQWIGDPDTCGRVVRAMRPEDVRAVTEELRVRFPCALSWYGPHTRRWWAILPARKWPYLIEAETPEELARKIARATELSQVIAERTSWGAYHDIAETLRMRIANGDYTSGSRFPCEAVLSAEFRVARNTLRRALAALEVDGLITVMPGVGRVVRACDSGTDVALPRYRCIADELRARIMNGELAAGDALPSEARLAQRHGVSRGTARQALVHLEDSGLVESVQGKGRFVARRPQTA